MPFGIDNQAFEGAARRSRSKAGRLNELLKQIFILQIQFNCVLRYFWLGTKENFLADHLSRGREWAFMQLVYVSMFWDWDTVPAPFPDRGRVRTLERQHVRVHRSTIEGFAVPRVDMMAYAMRVASAVIISAAVRGWLSRRRRPAPKTRRVIDHAQTGLNEAARVAAPVRVRAQPFVGTLPGGVVRVFLMLFAYVSSASCVDGNAAYIIQESSMHYVRTV